MIKLFLKTKILFTILLLATPAFNASFAAVRAKDYQEIKRQLARRSIDFNAKQDGQTILHVAAQVGDQWIAQQLLSKGASSLVKNDDGKYPYEMADAPTSRIGTYLIRRFVRDVIPHLADTRDNPDFQRLAEILISTRSSIDQRLNNDRENALHLAAKAGNENLVKFLLAMGANPLELSSQQMSAVAYATGETKKVLADVTKYRLGEKIASIEAHSPNSENVDVIHLLSSLGDINAVLNSDQETALHIAAAKNNLRLVKSLIELGADARIASREAQLPHELATGDLKEFLRERHHSESIRDELFDAIERQKTKKIDRIVNPSFDAPRFALDIRKNGQTPLHVAASVGNRAILVSLVGAGAPIFAKNHEGKYPYELLADPTSPAGIYLVRVSVRKMIQESKDGLENPAYDQIKELLLSTGHSIDQPLNQYKETALHIAARAKKHHLVEYLVVNGANPSVPSTEGRKAEELATGRSKTYLQEAENPASTIPIHRINPENLHEPIFDIAIAGPRRTSKNDQGAVVEAVPVSIKLLAPATKSRITITKDSDPNFKIKLDEEFFNAGSQIVHLFVDNTEGANVFRISGKIVKDHQNYADEFTLALRNLTSQTPVHMNVLREEEDPKRIDIAIRFAKPIVSTFDLEDRRVAALKEVDHFYAEKKPDIYIVFIDTMRRDVVTNPQIAPSIAKFANENVTPERYWTNGSATVYSVFSMMNSLSPVTTYNFFARDVAQEDYGSFPLKILAQKLGYKIHVFGNLYFNCLRENEPYTNERYYWGRVMQTTFGHKSSLVWQCTQPNADDEWINSEATPGDQLSTDVSWDDNVVKKALKKIDDIYQNDSESPHLFYLNFYSMQANYRFRNLPGGRRLEPSASDKTHLALTNNEKTRQNRNFTKLRNSYANAGIFTDLNFDDVIKFIDAKGERGRNAIVVVVGDHGELLGEKDFRYGHGARPYRERAESLVSFRFGADSPRIKERPMARVFSTMDLFPTLFDYMNIRPNISNYMTGKSFISGSEVRDSALTVRANNRNPIAEMVISNATHRVYLSHPSFNKWKSEEEKSSYYTDTRELRVIDITDLNDQTVIDQPPFSAACNPQTNTWSSSACKKVLLEHFRDGFREIFPNG